MREAITEHTADCVLSREGDEAAIEAESRRAAGILGLDEERTALEHGTLGTTALSSGLHYETFDEFALGVFSLGLAHCLVESGQIGAPRFPRPEEALHNIVRAVKERHFTDVDNGFEAARRHGGELRLGLLFENVSHIRESLDGHAPVFWWRGARLHYEMLVASNVVWATAAQRIKHFDCPRSPPYFILATVDRAGVTKRIFLHQVFASAAALVPTESSLEQAIAATLVDAREYQCKPVRMADVVWALRELGIPTPTVETWKYRPDFLGFRPRLQVIEVRGFPEGRFSEYDENFEAKRGYFANLLGPSCYRSINAVGCAPPSICSPFDWPSAPVSAAPLVGYSPI